MYRVDNREDALGDSERDGQRRSERGVQYPSDSLEIALEMLHRIKSEIGLGPASRETIAEALGHKGITGTSARKLGLLSHFDLLERVGAGALQVSELGRSVLLPRNDGELRHAIAEAAKRPTLFAALVERYRDHALPAMLSNLLTREHGVFAGSAEAAAKSFRETMEFAGLLRNGVLFAEPEAVAPEEPPLSSGVTAGHGDLPLTDAPGPKERRSPLATQHDDVQTYTIPLDGKGRMCEITLPLPVTERDMKKVGAWVSYMSTIVIEENETSDISAN